MKHWLVNPNGNTGGTRTACGKPWDIGDGTISAELVTCQACLDTVLRVVCNAVADEPGPLPARCARLVHEDGEHDWEPGPRSRQRADLQRQAITFATNAAIVVPNPQDAEQYAAAALRESAQRREAEEQRLAALETSTPSGRLWPRRRVIERWRA